MKKQFDKSYEDIISLENLLAAWQEFVCGKRQKTDVQEFGVRLMDNLLELHTDLANHTYRHGEYQAFGICDPKPRQIHKAVVRDRVVHHAVYRQLYPSFDRLFIADSFSCRLGKGTHKARARFASYGRKVSKNNTRTAWVLKCDIRKFFASINHAVLLDMLAAHIPDLGILLLLQEIIESFRVKSGVGLPLGNLTSQLFCNVYMNELDQFAKHKIKAEHYIRYADDFVFLSEDKDWLSRQLPVLSQFLQDHLRLSLHPDKVFIKTFASGVDFLGFVHFSKHQVLRTVTKRRMFRQLRTHPTNPTLQSYLGLLKHGDNFNLTQQVLNTYGLYTGK